VNGWKSIFGGTINLPKGKKQLSHLLYQIKEGRCIKERGRVKGKNTFSFEKKLSSELAKSGKKKKG